MCVKNSRQNCLIQFLLGHETDYRLTGRLLVLQISTGTLETAAGTITVKEFTYTDNIRYSALYLLFAYFWTSEFIVAMGQVGALLKIWAV